MTRTQLITGAVIVFDVAVLDAVLKWQAILHAPAANPKAIPSIIAFALHKNPGIAFDIPIPFFIILPLTAVIITVFGAYIGRRAVIEGRFFEALAATMVCLGALGNFVDRAINGFTTDYLILFRTSAINLSDLLILFGMAAFLWYHKNNPSSKTF